MNFKKEKYVILNSKKKLILYLFLTLIFTYTIFLSYPIFNIEYKIFPIGLSTLIWMIAWSSPSLFAFIFILKQFGKKELFNFLRKSLSLKGLSVKLLLFSLFFPLVVNIIFIIIHSIYNNNLNIIDYIYKPTLIIFLMQIPVVLFEEFGWRGYGLPQVQCFFNPFISSVIIGSLWAMWHLPLFYIIGSIQYGRLFLPFLFSAITDQIILTFIYNKSKGSLILVMIYHMMFNVGVNICIINSEVFPYIYFKIIIILIVGLIIMFKSYYNVFILKKEKT